MCGWNDKLRDEDDNVDVELLEQATAEDDGDPEDNVPTSEEDKGWPW
jgi:hypothetical protein